jgi:hypothetical protein
MIFSDKFDDESRAIKAYYVCVCDKFNLPLDEDIKNVAEIDMFEAVNTSPETTIRFIGCYRENIKLIKVLHQIKIKQSGVIYLTKENFRKIEFDDFIRTVGFHCYYIDKGIFLLQTPNKIKNDFLKKIKSHFKEYLSLTEKKVDFHKLPSNFDELLRVYFNKIQTDISHAAIGGVIDPKSNKIFEQFSQSGEISAVALLYPFKNIEHKIMITNKSGIVLLEKYESVEAELEVISDVVEKLLSNMW